MTITQQRIGGSRTVMHFGIIISAVGLYLLPVWSPLFGIGIALTWIGALQNCFDSMLVERNQITLRQVVMGAILITFGLYPVVTAISDYGHSLPQRLVIVIATIALQAIILLSCKNFYYPAK